MDIVIHECRSMDNIFVIGKFYRSEDGDLYLCSQSTNGGISANLIFFGNIIHSLTSHNRSFYTEFKVNKITFN